MFWLFYRITFADFLFLGRWLQSTVLFSLFDWKWLMIKNWEDIFVSSEFALFCSGHGLDSQLWYRKMLSLTHKKCEAAEYNNSFVCDFDTLAARSDSDSREFEGRVCEMNECAAEWVINNFDKCNEIKFSSFQYFIITHSLSSTSSGARKSHWTCENASQGEWHSLAELREDYHHHHHHLINQEQANGNESARERGKEFN